MSVVTPEFVPSAEARRAHSKHAEQPPCDGLRTSALALALTQYLMTTSLSAAVGLGWVLPAEFVLTGFLLASYLVRDRDQPGSPAVKASAHGPISMAGNFLRSLPTFPLFAVVAAILMLSRLKSLESLAVPYLQELPTLIVGGLRSTLDEFLQGSADGSYLIVWPLLLLFVPRRWLGPFFLAVLGAGLTIQFLGLLSGELGAASVVVAPSPLDLLATGALVAAIWQGISKSGNGLLARWAMLMGLALAVAAIGFQSRNGLENWGAVSLLSAPIGFGVVNFSVKIVATTLVGSLVWRDLGR